MLTMLRTIFTPGLEIKGSFWAFLDQELTESSLIVNFIPGRPTHLYFHSSFIKKNFFMKIKIKIINDILNLV